jgi:predicted transcriptional regulator
MGEFSPYHASPELPALSRRERQIMDAVYALGTAAATEVRQSLPTPPSLTAVRTMLTILVEKGHLKFRQEGARFIYEPVVPREQMARTMMDQVLHTFFEGSVELVVANLIDREDSALTDQDFDRLQAIIDAARRQGK